MKQILKNLKLVIRKIKLGIMVYFEYRSSLFFYTLSSFAWSISSILLQKFLFDEIHTLKGWSYGEFVLLNGIYNFAFAFFIMFSWGSIYEDLRLAVRKGKLDRILTKPLAHRFFLTFGNFDITGLLHLIPSSLIVYYSSRFIPFDFGLENLLLTIVYFFIGQYVINSIAYLFYASTFWFTSAEHISSAFWTMEGQSKVPLEIFPRTIRAALLSLLPLGFVAYIPTMALFDRLPKFFFLYTIIFILILTGLNRLVWKLGVKRYESVSS